MKRTVWLWELFGFAVTSLLGTLLHFMYDWSGEAVWIAPFSGVNESTWEHMKLLFWPMLLFTITQSFFFKDYVGFWHIKLRSILIGLSLIPLIFYVYNGVIGKSPDWVNIAIFFISTAVAYLYGYLSFKNDSNRYEASHRPIIILCFIALLFIIFTFNTPRLGIFTDPLTGAYGI